MFNNVDIYCLSQLHFPNCHTNVDTITLSFNIKNVTVSEIISGELAAWNFEGPKPSYAVPVPLND